MKWSQETICAQKSANFKSLSHPPNILNLKKMYKNILAVVEDILQKV